MSKTPRIDEHLRMKEENGHTVKVGSEFARQLERDLADKNKQLYDYIDTVAAMCFAARGGECNIETLQKEMNAVSTKPSEYIRYSVSEKDRQLAEARADAEHWKGECNALQRMVHEARAEIERLKKALEKII